MAGAISGTAAFIVLMGGTLLYLAAILVYSYVVWRNDPDARKNTASRA